MKLKFFLNSLLLFVSCQFAFANFHDVEGIYHIQQVDGYDEIMNQFKTNPESFFQNPLERAIFAFHFSFIHLKSNHEYTYGVSRALIETKINEAYGVPEASKNPAHEIAESGKWSIEGNKIIFKRERKYRASRLYSIELEKQDGENYTGSAHINTSDVSIKLVKYQE